MRSVRATGIRGALVATLAAACATSGVRDLDGHTLDPLAGAKAATVLLFVDPECPISNAYAPEVRRLHEEFALRGVCFWLVYADPERTPDEIRAHIEAYAYPMRALFDSAHELVERCGATLTPEACVFTAAGELVYRGRIDDRYVDFGKQRAAPTTRDLRAALEALLAGERPEQPWPGAIGCAIPGGPVQLTLTRVPGPD